jgi:hypothetical protein
VINDAHHWKIVWSGMRVALAARDKRLAEAVGTMIAKREGASEYENMRALVELLTKRARARLDGATEEPGGAG